MEEKKIFRLPIYQFLGNHFNILFINAGGVYYLFDHLVHFFDNIKLEKRLLVAVHWDLKVLGYKVGCQALGLIEKLITGPLWRIMNKEKCVLGVSKHYQNLLECFEKWEVDCTSFLNNKTFCDSSFVSNDECFESLCTLVCTSAITPELEKEAVTVSTTNANPERDFGMLNRLMRVKPKALDLVYEEVIMFLKNKPAEWRDQLNEENLGKAMECARKSKQ